MNIIEIVHQGAPIIQSATLLYKNEDVMIVCIEMQSSCCAVDVSSGNAVWLRASRSSRRLHGDDMNAATEVRVDPEYNQFLAWGSGRYNINLVFAKACVYEREHQDQIFDLPKEEK
jgi:hypothetical protein